MISSERLFQTGLCLFFVVLAGCASDQALHQKLISEELRANALRGDPVAQRQLGAEFDFGQQDQAQAAKWYQMAADQGDAIAQNNLGSLYQHGLGVATNLSLAAELYRKSAGQGFAMAQNSLGYMYDFGLGVQEDKVEANSWYRRSAEQGFPEAMMNLGINYAGGWGVSRDPSEAFMWLDLARFFTQQSQDMKVKWRIRGVLDDFRKEMTREQIREGERRSREWYESYAKGHKRQAAP